MSDKSDKPIRVELPPGDEGPIPISKLPTAREDSDFVMPPIQVSGIPTDALETLAASAREGSFNYQKLMRFIDEREKAADETVAPEVAGTPDPPQKLELAPSDAPTLGSANPMHPRDRRLYTYLGIWAAIFIAVISSGIAAFVGNSPHWGAALCGGGLLGAYLMSLHLLEKRPTIPTAKWFWGSLIAAAVVSWGFNAAQIWINLRRPVQGYTQTQLDAAVSAAKTPIQTKLDEALSEAKSARAQLAQKSGAIYQAPSAPNLGRVSWSNLYNGFTQPGQLRQLSGWWIIITAAPENSEAEKELSTIFMLSSNLSKTFRLAGLPDYSRDLDAPKLEGKALRGITIHGRNDAADFVAATLSNCFLILQTAEMPTGLFGYYHHQSSTTFSEDKFIWLEIGKGSPWKGNCRD